MTTVEMLHDLAAVNLEKYSRQLILGLRNQTYMGGKVQVGATVHYMKLWLSMVEKGMNILTLNAFERAELKDAINDRLEVHLLEGGMTLCGRFWPDYQKDRPEAIWIGFNDPAQHEFVNCRGCLLAKKLVTEKKG